MITSRDYTQTRLLDEAVEDAVENLETSVIDSPSPAYEPGKGPLGSGKRWTN